MRRGKVTLVSLTFLFVTSSAALAAGDAARGRDLFNNPGFAGGAKACSECHPGGRGLDKAADKKVFHIMGGTQKSLEEAVNLCIENANKGKAIDPGGAEMADIIAYIKSLKGIPPVVRASKAGGRGFFLPVFLLKSILSIVLVLSALFAMFTMFEILGRSEKRYNADRLRKIHKANGIVYVLLFLFIAYFCIKFISDTKTELSPRASLHAVFAIAILILLFVKVLYVRVYRQFYGRVQVLGLLVALVTFLMAGISGGYYLLVTGLGADMSVARFLEKKPVSPAPEKVSVRTDQESIMKGRELYMSKCFLCHDPYGSERIVGPGHKGILKNPLLPVSGKPATPENVANQLRNPYSKMPSFAYLSGKQALDIIAFLNTL